VRRATRSLREKSAAPKSPVKLPRYVFRLYVSGNTPRSTRAIRNIRKICEEHLSGRYDLEVIDIYQQPGLAVDHQIIAAPTLIKSLPLPLRRFIGDISETERVLIGIGLRPAIGSAAS
jgi:circadian clock protein KaiB